MLQHYRQRKDRRIVKQKKRKGENQNQNLMEKGKEVDERRCGMTFEDAICWLKLLKESKVNWINVAEDEFGLVKRCEEAKVQAIDMAIEALSADTVSREFYEDAVKANIRIVIKNRELKAQIESADRPSGEWIRWVVNIEDETGVSYIPHAKCSNCGTEQDSYATQFINFCPYCGAYMAKENEE